MTEPILKLRTPDERRAWIEGWLNARDLCAIPTLCVESRQQLIDTLAERFREQLAELLENR